MTECRKIMRTGLSEDGCWLDSRLRVERKKSNRISAMPPVRHKSSHGVSGTPQAVPCTVHPIAHRLMYALRQGPVTGSHAVLRRSSCTVAALRASPPLLTIPPVLLGPQRLTGHMPCTQRGYHDRTDAWCLRLQVVPLSTSDGQRGRVRITGAE